MKKKILSLLTAFAMVFGIIAAPFTTASAAGESDQKAKEDVTKTVVVHKILMSKEALDKHDVNKDSYTDTEGKQQRYQGNKITNIADYFSDTTAEEIPNVYFVVEKETKTKGAWAPVNAEGKFESELASGEKFEPLGGLTTDNGLTLDTSKLPAGEYQINEDHSKSTYVGKDGKALTDMKAVPTKIKLPAYNDKGLIEELHLYPKNTEDKPQIDKNFSADEAKKYMSDEEKTNLDNAIAHKAAFEKAKKLYKQGSTEYTNAEQAYTAADKTLIEKWGIDFEANTRGKQTRDKKIGDDVEYTVVTEVPAKTKWGQAYWDDKMTDGLTYNKDLTIELKKGENKIDLVAPKENNGKSTIDTPTNEQPESDYTISQDDNGFVLEFTKTGLKKLNNQAEVQTITLKYNAKVNSSTVVDVPESNDVTFHYGNRKGHGTTPLPVKPNDNGELTITKNWADGTWAEGESATFKLVDANTGKDVTANDLDQVAGYTFQSTVTLSKNGTTSYTWKGLKKDRQYKAIETNSTTKSDAEYKLDENGNLVVTNYNTTNPPPLNPSEPKVVTGGKKFVKTNQDGKERLAGAKFVITRKLDANSKVIQNTDTNTAVAKTQYLAYKSSTATSKEVTDYDTAEDNYNKFIKAYNDKVAEVKKANEDKKEGTQAQQVFPWSYDNATYNDEAAVKTKLADLKKKRDAAFLKARNNFDWIDAKDAKTASTSGALVLTSDDQGRLEITGLAYGDYQLEEIEPPKDYAKLSDVVKFTISATSYTTDDVNIKYNLEDQSNTAKQIINKKVTIPQTGGIGSLIFIVAGAAIMIGAFVAYKKSQAVEA